MAPGRAGFGSHIGNTAGEPDKQVAQSIYLDDKTGIPAALAHQYANCIAEAAIESPAQEPRGAA
jgi:hypothetical protein